MAGSIPAPSAAATPSESEVRAGLQRIVGSRAFSAAPKLAAFLRFVVEESLAGRGSNLKEYSIGIGALGKPDAFDPANDSTVRVAARQLRFKLREYFADEGRDDALLIELPKGAYVPQFARRIVQVAPALQADTTATEPPLDAGAQTVVLSTPARRWARIARTTLMLAAVIATTALVTVKIVGQKRNAAGVSSSAASAAVGGKSISIVVLPFLNLSGSATDEYVSDGITEELTAMLARSSDLRVVARTSAFRYKGTSKDVRTIASELSANAVLEGSVRQSKDKYRITAQLISATDGVHLWASTFDVDKRDLFKAYDDIAQSLTTEINRQLNANIGAVHPRVATRDAEAHALYLEARFNWNKRTADAIQRSIKLFGQAIARDSMYALAYAGLADAYATLAVNSMTAPGESPPKAIAAAEHALAIDPTLGEPHAAIGLMRAFQDYEWKRADEEFATAIRLSPNYSTAHSWYSITLLARGRFDEALHELEQAQRLDPLSLAHAYGVAENRYYARKWAEAEAKTKRVLELEPQFSAAQQLLGKIYAMSGRPVEARTWFLASHDTLMMFQYDTASNKRAEVKRRMALLPAEVVERFPIGMAGFHVLLGDFDAAFKWLDRAYEMRQLDLVSLKVDPIFDSIRRDPRYLARLHSMGLD